jgi:transcriptional regulator with GAF, ATPase, and Fis domain
MRATMDNEGVPATIRTLPQVSGVSRGRQAPDGIVGHAPRFEETLERIDRVSATNTTVLITGETGTGKELVARAIHRRSQRSSHAMVCANLAALPNELVASELFGHEVGAFTGAVQRRIGRFEAAHASTLFLDEIGELPLGVQVSLLRALQEGEFERIGSNQTKTVDLRIIAATNRNLEQAIDDGLFRRDLFYRLAVFPIHLPPLRERREDIPSLADHFLVKVAIRLGRSFSGIDAESMARLIEYSWPGNIRELQNVIEHSAILSDGDLLTVPPALVSTRISAGPTTTSSLGRAMESGERRLIEHALEHSNGRVFGPTGAATRLGVPSSTLESKIKRLRINKHQYRSSDA